MASSPATSTTSDISGLGITFQQASANLSPTAPAFQPASPQPHIRALPPHIRQQRTLKHSASSDDGMLRRGMAQHAYAAPAPLEGRPRVQLAGDSPEFVPHARVKPAFAEYGLPANLALAYGYLSPEALSDQTFSSASSPSGSGYSPHQLASPQESYIPQPMSNLPSAEGYGALPSVHYTHQDGYQGKPHTTYDGIQAPGMGAYVSRPYPPSSAAPTAGHSPYERSSFSTGTGTPSRLPPFLRARQDRALARPQSMLELNATYARQAQEVPGLLHARRTEVPFAYSSCGEMSPEEDKSRFSVASPQESIPSSAGGLQRRHYERQLADVRAEKAAAEARAEELAQAAATCREVKHSRSQENLRSSAGAVEQRRTRTRSRSMSAAGYPDADEDLVRTSPALGRARGHARTKSDLVGGRRPSRMDALEAAERAHGMDDTAPSPSVAELSEEDEPVPALPQRAHSVISHASDAQSTARSGASASSHASNLSRQTTLLTAGANPTRRRHELDRLLAPTSTKAAIAAAVNPAMLESPASASTASLAPSALTRRTVSRASSHPNLSGALVATPVILEQSKSSSRARVELDLVLESAMVVEGGSLKGKVEVKVRRQKTTEGELWLGSPKVRVVGFEELASQEARHIFFHHAASISTLPSGAQLPLHSGSPDEENFSKALEGSHAVPFSMRLPVGKGAKGSWKSKQGVVKYILIASIKLKSAQGADRSIAHFYRTVDVYPYFPPALALAPAAKPLVGTESKGLFMGGSGKVTLTARIHRGTWVAGQMCYVDVGVENDTTKRVKNLSLALIRTTTVSRPPQQRARQPSAESQISNEEEGFTVTNVRKKVAEATLEMGKKAAGVTARGSWMGVDAGESANFSHALLIPSEALTVPKGKHLEVSYVVRVSVGGSLSSDVSTEIPVRIVNFVSLDPPPGHIVEEETPALRGQRSSKKLNKSWSTDKLRTGQIQREERSVRPMPSVEELRLEDLNLNAAPTSHHLGHAPSSDSLRVDSYRSLRTRPGLSSVGEDSHIGLGFASPQESRVDPSEGSLHRDSVSTSTSFGCATIGRAHGRALTHQASLECISNAIASATARRGNSPLERKKSTLSMATTTVDEDEREDRSETSHWDERARAEYEQLRLHQAQQDAGRRAFELAQRGGQARESRIELDDLDDEDDVGAVDDAMAYRSPARLDYTDDSEEEIDAVMQGGLAPEEEDELADSRGGRPAFDASVRPQRSSLAPSARSPATAHAPACPAKVISRPSSPVKQDRPTSSPGPSTADRKSGKFAYATPGSPLKAKVSSHAELSPAPAGSSAGARSPVRKVLSQADLSAGAGRRPLPTAPTSRPTSVASAKVALPSSPVKAQAPAMKKQVSTVSLREEHRRMRKAASTLSLASMASSAMHPSSSAESAEPVLSPPTSSSIKSSPEFAKVMIPPQLSTSPSISVTSVLGYASSPRSSARSPSLLGSASPKKSPRTLHSSKSMSSLRSQRSPDLAPSQRLSRGPAPQPPPPRQKPVVLASVQSKILQLESRQNAINAFSQGPPSSGAQTLTVSGAGLQRSDSVASEAPSFRLADLERANSFQSFKAPLLKRRTVVEE